MEKLTPSSFAFPLPFSSFSTRIFFRRLFNSPRHPLT